MSYSTKPPSASTPNQPNMPQNKHHQIPAEGFKGLIQNWRPDFIAAFTVALVAMPLALGIALASEVKPMAGIISAVIGGIVATFYRGGHLGISGPAAGLIVVVISTVQAFNGQYQHALGVFCVAGVLQAIFGVFRLGKFGDFFPNSVINGMLAAIGIIILSKQAHIALGVSEIPHGSFDALIAIPKSLIGMNPVVALISLASLVVLILHPQIKSKFIRIIPAPMWVLIVAIPMAFIFQLNHDHTLEIFNHSIQLGEHLLIQIPSNPFEGIAFPSFEKINELKFWGLAITIALISSIETLLISKAVDKLDPYRRKTNFNKDLIGIGLASTAAAAVGGLPIITVIARSSVNVQNGAKTKWSNLYHSIILLVLVIFFEKALQRVPLAALAAILVYTGYKLASPKLFADTYKKGVEQILILALTVLTTLISGILWGILIGTLFTIFIHFIKVGYEPIPFFRSIFKPTIKTKIEQENKVYLEIEGVSNFFTILKLQRKLVALPPEQHVVASFTHAHLVDHTILEYIHDFSIEYERKGGIFDIVGLGKHVSSSTHPDSLHLLLTNGTFAQKSLTQRQQRLDEIAKANRWHFNPQVSWDTSFFQDFEFLQSKPIEYVSNTINGVFQRSQNKSWTISDITFNEGALIVTAVYHTTVLAINLTKTLPVFILEKGQFMEFMERALDLKDIHLQNHPELSKRYHLKAYNETSIQELFDKEELIEFLLNHERYHIECNGNSLLIFKKLRFASIQEILAMHKFAELFIRKLDS